MTSETRRSEIVLTEDRLGDLGERNAYRFLVNLIREVETTGIDAAANSSPSEP